MTSSIEITERFERGLSWARAGEGLLACRSHALVDDDGGVWLVDPIDGVGLDGMLEELGGPVVGVIVLLDRHLRDAPDVARRHGAPLLVPPGRWRAGHPRPRGARALMARVDGCPFSFFPVVERDGAWLEHALWWEAAELLVVAEAVGTTDYCTLGSGAPLGIHPALRFGTRRSGLTELSHRPSVLLVGHGDLVRDVDGDLRARIRGAARHARSGIPRLVARVPAWISGGLRARRAGRRLSC